MHAATTAGPLEYIEVLPWRDGAHLRGNGRSPACVRTPRRLASRAEPDGQAPATHAARRAGEQLPVCRGAAGAADRPAAFLLLPRDVPATADQRPEQCRLGPGLPRGGLFDGGLAVASEDRFDPRRAADRRSGLRLPAGLVTGRTLHRLCVCSGGGDRAVAA